MKKVVFLLIALFIFATPAWAECGADDWRCQQTNKATDADGKYCDQSLGCYKNATNAPPINQNPSRAESLVKGLLAGDASADPSGRGSESGN